MFQRNFFVFILAILLAAGGVDGPVAEGAEAEGALGYYHHPDVHGDLVVFVSEGDLWTVPLAGGLARRLTTTPGEEEAPRFSPDGRWIAFTATYQGGAGEVWILPTTGGDPRRLTYHPAGATVLGFTPDGTQVVYRSSRDQPLGYTRAWKVPVQGGSSQLLPFGRVGHLDFSADGKKVAFDRFTADELNCRRYLGGQAGDLFLGDADGSPLKAVTTWKGADTWPMWHGERVYFLSDRTGILNLWSLNGGGGDLRQHSRFEEIDAGQPSLGGDVIVFQRGPELWAYHVLTGEARALDIRLASDRLARQPRSVNLSTGFTRYAAGPGGERIFVESRGEVASFPAREGRRIDITRSPGTRERGMAVSPDGGTVAVWTDSGGEEELALYPADGMKGPIRHPATRGGWHFPPVWSPRGDALAYGDQTGSLWIYTPGTGQRVKVDQDTGLEISVYAFSPDGRWLTWCRTVPNRNKQVWLYDHLTSSRTAVTDENYNSYSPAWDPGGRFLYFASQRNFDPFISGDDSSSVYSPQGAADHPEFQAYFSEIAQPFAIALQAGQPSPVSPPDPLRVPALSPSVPSTKTSATAPGKKGGGKSGETAKEALPPVLIDLPGILHRTFALDATLSNIVVMGAAEGKALWLSSNSDRLSAISMNVPFVFGVLNSWSIEERKVVSLATMVGGFSVAADGKTIACERMGSLLTLPSSTSSMTEGEGVNLQGWSAVLSPPQEWKQVFRETWRMYRDFFWSPTMVGMDWEAVGRIREEWLSRVGSRDELNRVIGDALGELQNPHAYILGGDAPSPQQIPVGTLGADLVWDEGRRCYRVSYLAIGHSWDPMARSPLRVPEARVEEGACVWAIDGTSLEPQVEPLSLLLGKAGQDVVVRVGPSADPNAARNLLVPVLADDREARYLDWVDANRETVARRSADQVGYLHARDMMGLGLADFSRGWFSQHHRRGLILDLRANGGGYVSQLLIQRLTRSLVGFTRGRNQDPERNDFRAFYGVLTVLCDQLTSSDGEGFTETFRALGLGKVVGSRTWGGLVGFRVGRTLQDGGFSSQPEFGSYGMDGRWQVEGVGITPDVEVDWDPQSFAEGRDPQLEKAIEVVLKELSQDPHALPPSPPHPNLGLEQWRKDHPAPAVP